MTKRQPTPDRAYIDYLKASIAELQSALKAAQAKNDRGVSP